MSEVCLNTAYRESCGNPKGNMTHTNHKGVSCPMCLAKLHIADTGGYHFPATKFVEHNDSFGQSGHVTTEFREWKNEDPFSWPEILEAWDLLHSVETWLRIRQKEGADVMAAKAAVLKKNADRGYYDCEITRREMEKT